MSIQKFSVARQARHLMPPLLIIELEAAFKKGQNPVSVRHAVVGYNL
jgi:prepilin peptidase dependent protein B